MMSNGSLLTTSTPILTRTIIRDPFSVAGIDELFTRTLQTVSSCSAGEFADCASSVSSYGGQPYQQDGGGGGGDNHPSQDTNCLPSAMPTKAVGNVESSDCSNHQTASYTSTSWYFITFVVHF